MIRHVALFRLVEGATEEQVAAAVEGLRTLPEKVPSLRSYVVGTDLGLGEGRWDLAVLAEFDDAEGYHAYAGHPAHRAVAEELVLPIRADRAIIQIEA